MKLYIETSVVSFVFAEDDADRSKITRDFFAAIIHKHEEFISELVLEEIEKTLEPKKSKISEFIKKRKFKVLESRDEAEKLANKYVERCLIPEKYYNDALHIALAVINAMEVIVSWNMEHIVKLKTIVGVNKTNKEEGYPTILINTPEEVLE